MKPLSQFAHYLDVTGEPLGPWTGVVPHVGTWNLVAGNEGKTVAAPVSGTWANAELPLPSHGANVRAGFRVCRLPETTGRIEAAISVWTTGPGYLAGSFQSGYSFRAFTGDVRIVRTLGGVDSTLTLIGADSALPTLQDGDEIVLEVQDFGTVIGIRTYLNGRLCYCACDPSPIPLNGGRLSITGRGNSTSDKLAFYAVGLESFEASGVELVGVWGAYNSGASAVANLPSPPTPGHLLIGECRAPSGLLIPPPGFTLVNTSTWPTDARRMNFFYRVVEAGDPTSYAFDTANGGEKSVVIYELAGADPVNPVRFFDTVNQLNYTEPLYACQEPVSVSKGDFAIASAHYVLGGTAVGFSEGFEHGSARWRQHTGFLKVTESRMLRPTWTPSQAQGNNSAAAGIVIVNPATAPSGARRRRQLFRGVTL